ncbi:hypothetical protein I553_0955 [Mycobacterium xenopi 4042]|uniref:Uncharacterized protein n=1 Tax=Mycobacterium xenopi 4042 TaxID=1299334 RepID=X7ZBL6_MYCXE|nr:hypothetical protein I553_0955 [Mycobacterium xenopi 4042]EUA42830.1 hypothetical protein I552_7571 [Mycobacterium xenopi 3993]
MNALVIEQLNAKPRHLSTLIGVEGARQPPPEKSKLLLDPSCGGSLTLRR